MAPNTTPPNGTNPTAAAAPLDEPRRVGDLTQLVNHAAQHARRPNLMPLGLDGSDPDKAVLLVPAGYALKSIKPLLDEYRTSPELRAGTTTLHDLASFVFWTNRHKDAGTVIYADDRSTPPSLVAIIDHDEPGAEAPDEKARFGRHRGVYPFLMSREWQEWTTVSRSPLKTGDFAEFLERRMGDVQPPPYSVDGDGNGVFESQDPEIRKLVLHLGKRFATVGDLAKLMRGIELNVDATAKVQINRDTGEHAIEYSESNGQGADRIKPPNAFLIAIPVLHNGPAVLIAVHLRYRAAGGQVVWTLELHHPDRVLEEVWRKTLDEVFDMTGLTPLRGVAPAAR